MKIDITDIHFIELQKKGYTLDMVIILSWAHKNLCLDHIIDGSTKIKAIHATMQRKGLLSDDNKITKPGMEILDFISKKTNKKFEKTKVSKSDFDKWWEVFPSNDKFEVRGRSFGPTRSLKSSKEEGRRLFNKLVLDGEYTTEQIIDATEFDINLKKERSYKEGTNNLKFLQNSSTYLRNTSFSGFIGMEKLTKITEKTKLGSIDI